MWLAIRGMEEKQAGALPGMPNPLWRDVHRCYVNGQFDRIKFGQLLLETPPYKATEKSMSHNLLATGLPLDGFGTPDHTVSLGGSTLYGANDSKHGCVREGEDGKGHPVREI